MDSHLSGFWIYISGFIILYEFFSKFMDLLILLISLINLKILIIFFKDNKPICHKVINLLAGMLEIDQDKRMSSYKLCLLL